jgi:hypothetical protein
MVAFETFRRKALLDQFFGWKDRLAHLDYRQQG